MPISSKASYYKVAARFVKALHVAWMVFLFTILIPLSLVQAYHDSVANGEYHTSLAAAELYSASVLVWGVVVTVFFFQIVSRVPFRWKCPLTVWEQHLRALAGETVEWKDGWIAAQIEQRTGIKMPWWVVTAGEILIIAIILRLPAWWFV